MRPLMLAVLAVLAAASPALAGPSSPRTAVVTMGDSYISGEAGRWAGNSPTSAGDRDGTDRTCAGQGPTCTSYDQTKVYGDTAGECHRSDVAPVLTAPVPVDEKLNIACSGGRARNIWRASQGGQPKGGEPLTQGDQLAVIAREKAVKLIVVSVGGNDLGFAPIVTACVTAYASRSGPCRAAQQPRIDAEAAKAQAAVEKAIDEIRAVMAGAGYERAQYRLVLQTYPIVIPRAAEARHPEPSPERTTFGCPFYDTDLDWARDEAGPQIGGVVKAAARSRGAEVLDLIDAFQGHEVCARTARAAGPASPVTAVTGEWGRAVSPSTIQQSERQELFHPNAFGQSALGACIAGVLAATAPGEFRCTSTPGRAADGMQVMRTGDVAAPAAGPAAGARACPGSPADAARAVPRGRGLRFVLPAGRTFTVDVLQQSSGRVVLGNRRVARFAARRGSFTWSGARARDGVHVVRFTTGADEGRVALTRRRGRFRARPDYAESPGCGVVRLFKLERPVFGGVRNRALGIAVKLDRDAEVRIRVLRGARVLRDFGARTARRRQVLRVRLGAERLPRGEVRVELRVGGERRVLAARRL